MCVFILLLAGSAKGQSPDTPPRVGEAAPAAPTTESAADTPFGTDYRIGPRDKLTIRVFEEGSLDATPTVGANGRIEFPPLGEVEAAGKNTQELARDLKLRLEERFLQRATVSVELLEFRARPISVIGAVDSPGKLNLSGSLTLIEAITEAGGLVANHGPTVHVLRTAANGLSDQIVIDLDALLVAADRRLNIPIFADDVINIPTQVERIVYFLGEVNREGALQFGTNERFTLLAAVAKAGGLTERAGRKVTVKRQSLNGVEERLEFDYRDVVTGRAPDPHLESGDVLNIKESFF